MLLENSLDTGLGEQPDAIHFAAAGQGRVHPSDRARVADPARCGNLRPAPSRGPGLGGGQRRASESAARDRVGVRQPIEPDAGGNEFAHPAIVGRIQADMEIRAQGLGDLFAKELPDEAAGNPSYDFALEVALGHGVIARARAGFPPGCLGGEARADCVPVVEFLHLPQWRVETREPRAVTHHVRDPYALFAILGEFGPVVGDWRLEIDLPPVGKQENAERRHGLGGGVDVDQGVFGPGRALGVRIAPPQVHDRLSRLGDRDAGPEFEFLGEIVFKGLLDRLETRLAKTLRFHDWSSSWRGAPILTQPAGAAEGGVAHGQGWARGYPLRV